MRQLSSLDAQFLHVESTTTAGHVGGLLILDPSGAPGGELTLSALRAVLEPRLHLADLLRQRLVEVPLGLGRPYWVDDPEFDLEFHLREVALPAPGNAVQLGEQVARIHARPLDRTHPLWEMYLIHGVEGERSAIYSKVHHAAIDGVSGAEILATIMDLAAEPRVVEDDDWTPAPLPGTVTLLERGLLSTITQPWHLVRTLPKTLPHLADLPGAANVPVIRAISDLSAAVVKVATGQAASSVERRELVAPRTPFNSPITAHRRFSFGSLPLAELKRIKNAFGMSVNDVVMAMCTSALRRWLLDHDALPATPIIVAEPVSIRGDDNQGPGGNQISVMLAEMPTQVGEPAERLALVATAMTEAKRRFQAVPATILQDVSTVIPTALAGLAARQLFRLVTAPGLPFNLFVSNVPGPQVPLYVAGARVLGLYPVSAVSDMTGGLNITLFSYNGSVDFGLIACRELVPDLWNLIDYLRDALAELSALVPADASG